MSSSFRRSIREAEKQQEQTEENDEESTDEESVEFTDKESVEFIDEEYNKNDESSNASEEEHESDDDEESSTDQIVQVKKVLFEINLFNKTLLASRVKFTDQQIRIVLGFTAW